MAAAVLVRIFLILGRFCRKSALREAPSSDDRVAFDSSELLALHAACLQTQRELAFIERADVYM